MKGKILLVVGLGIGYVLGTRAGRERYEEIRATASRLWNNPRVQKTVDEAGDLVSDGAKRVVSQMTGSRPTGSKPAARTTAERKGTASTSSTPK
jgi:hypothetical protein